MGPRISFELLKTDSCDVVCSDKKKISKYRKHLVIRNILSNSIFHSAPCLVFSRILRLICLIQELFKLNASNIHPNEILDLLMKLFTSYIFIIWPFLFLQNRWRVDENLKAILKLIFLQFFLFSSVNLKWESFFHNAGVKERLLTREFLYDDCRRCREYNIQYETRPYIYFYITFLWQKRTSYNPARLHKNVRKIIFQYLDKIESCSKTNYFKWRKCVYFNFLIFSK